MYNLDRIAREREYLRIGTEAAAEHCRKAGPYGDLFAEKGLPAMIAQYKDIFITRVATILQETYGMSQAKSIDEAVALAEAEDL
ncbi:hypothetical protein FRC09_012500 [Ceratobasidium sp. 395]|nr:hypothetical protein FRC09_012500 [Ceratobasidium sp. 395]